jgi:hypothetical protein
VLSVTLSLTMKWIKSRARRIWQNTVSWKFILKQFSDSQVVTYIFMTNIP